MNAMKYDPAVRLFLGLPNKETHYKILEQYYGHMSKVTLRWAEINNMVDKMFTSQYGDLGRKKVDFFGNDAVCLFKYFVKPGDPQQLYVWGVLLVNLACFVIITTSYVTINIISLTASKMLAQSPSNQAIKERNRTLQRKISIIIASDFLCW